MSCSAWMVATIECIERSRARDSCAISAPSPTIGRSVSASASSSSSSTPTTVGPGAAQHPAAYDVVRLGRGRLVEHGGRGRPPVDQQRVAVVVAQADPADVARLGVELGAQVEAAEDQALVGGVELGDPLRGLEDHGVALDEAALVAEPAAARAPPGPAAARPRADFSQLDVHPVHERLLGSDLPLDQLFATSRAPHPTTSPVTTRARRRASSKTSSLPARSAARRATSCGTGTRSSPRGPRRRRTAARRARPAPRRARRSGRPGRG